jgi:hypothetical protein
VIGVHHLGLAVIAYILLAGLGFVSLFFLAIQTKDWLDGRSVRDEASHDAFVAPQEARVAESPAPRVTPQPASADSPARAELQRLLNRGVSLEQNAAGLAGLGRSLVTPVTQLEDVEAWEAEVEAALRNRPRDIGLFYYERPRSPLDALGTVSALENPLKRRLQQRVRQLETIIGRTR